MLLTPGERDALWFHLAFGLLSVLVLVLPAPVMGARIWLLLMAYHIGLPAAGYWRGHREWVAIWWFLLPLSILMIFPDWFLSAQLGSLVFPDIGAPMIGSVSSFMALMWAIPLFLVIMVGEGVRRRWGTAPALFATGATAVLIFGVSEAFAWRIPLWHARDVTRVGHIALYVLPAELLLGVYTWAGYRLTRNRGFAARLGTALGIMLLYLGALALGYLLIETL